MWTKTLQNWLLNAEISYTIYLSTLNSKWDSNFWNLNFMNCKKINKCVGNQTEIDICIFQVSISFHGFFQTSIPTINFKASKIFTSNSRTFHTFPAFSPSLCRTSWTVFFVYKLYIIRFTFDVWSQKPTNSSSFLLRRLHQKQQNIFTFIFVSILTLAYITSSVTDV